MTKEQADYQKLQAELDDVLAQLQNPNIAVDDAIKLHEKGMLLVEKLEAYLSSAENKINKIKESFGA